MPHVPDDWCYGADGRPKPECLYGGLWTHAQSVLFPVRGAGNSVQLSQRDSLDAPTQPQPQCQAPQSQQGSRASDAVVY